MDLRLLQDSGYPRTTTYSLLGHATGVSFFHKLKDWKRQYGDVFGIFVGRNPALVISDLDILKEVLVKSFSTFRNRLKFLLIPSPLSLSVFFLEDAPWKRVRSIISPTFSSGKLRHMCAAINQCGATLSKNFCADMKKKEGVNMKEYFGAYTMDVITQTVFGVKVDSQNDFNNPFVTNAKAIFTLPKARRILPVLAGLVPGLEHILLKLGLGVFPQRVLDFFQTAVTEIMKQRQNDSKEQQKKRSDFLQLLMEAEIEDDADDDTDTASGQMSDKHTVRRLSVDEIVGQGIIFFIAGYDTTASTLTFASYCLAMNQDAQEKAYKEIREVLGNAVPDYDNIWKLKYLDNVITETLRLYPPGPVLTRRASETVQIKDYTITEGQVVFIPIFAMQRDPELFQDPDSFRPERHDEKINPLTFLSFGYGPRMCVGMRLALMETKIALIHLLRTIKLEPMPDTQEVMTFKISNILTPEKEIRLKLSSRC
ncbi:cytochrome P450 3A29-like [Haliotis rubra]|uniref:cytochrome P450 3A29-like n=1 Tax=Haliotis rubra TaxID=36100 RepID=UPI001EE58BBB|nr:cytochrome P450 3A29-like [Haliotis rubra]